jgi:hypothetical protein
VLQIAGGDDHAPAVWVVSQNASGRLQEEMVLDAEKRLIDTPRLNLVGRMHGRGWYARTRDLFEAPHIARER